MRRLIFAAIFLVLVLVACTAPAQNAEIPSAQEPAAPKTTTQTAATADPGGLRANPEVTKLLERNSQVKSYSFDLAELPDRRGSHTYYVKGNKVKVVPIDPVVIGSTGIVEIYLDLEKETAVGHCARARSCPDPNKEFAMDFSDYDIVWPHEWIDQIKYGEVAGTVTFGNKPVTRVKYQADGKYYEAYLDNYFGMPQRIAIASDPEMTKIVGGYEYRNMAFNSIQDTDVTYQKVTVT